MKRFLLLFLLMFIAAACAEDDAKEANPVDITKQYVQARVGADEEKLRALACADFEEIAVASAESFASVKATVEDLQCEQSGTEGDITLVACTGTISMVYDAETRTRALDATFQMKQEDGQWKVCGE
jgi:hypothetical protein